jgi:hypothetical protein
MNNSNEGGGIKIALIICIMFMIGFMVAFYLVFKDQKQFKDEAVAAKASANDSDRAAKDALEQITILKKVIGHEMDVVGDSKDDTDKNHVVGAMNDDIKTYGGELAQTNYAATIVELRNQITNLSKERDQLKLDLQKERETLLATREQYQQQVSAHQKNRADAQADLETRITGSEKMITERDGQITRARRELSETQLELQKQQESAAITEKNLKTKEKDLIKLNDILRDDIENIKKVSFEKPDGEIRWVDNATKLAWINLGSDDNLPKQLSFSIYGPNNMGVARGQKDIKGALEVTRILGPHLAEARIVSVRDVVNPINPGDVIYTPLWQQGRIEYFSIVGMVDLDNDGLSDRQLLHDIITSAGAKIDNEVDDEGNMIGNGITVDTKFLITAAIPDPAGLPPDSKELEEVKKIIQHRSELVEQARLNAVKRINLNDFLSYIGYVPKQRLYVPGQSDNNFRLKAGQTQTKTNDPSTGKAGNTSKLFEPKRDEEN